MMYLPVLICVSYTLFPAVTSAIIDVDSSSKGIRSENLLPDTPFYKNGWWDRDDWWDRKNFKCPSAWGQYPDPDDCSSYYVCSGSKSKHKRCGRNKLFDMYRKVCLPKALAICDSKDKGKTTRKTTPSSNVRSTTPNDDQFSCPSVFGLYPHPKYCAKYFSCTIFLPSVKSCPSSQLFDAVKKECRPEDQVHCGSRERPTISTSVTPSTVSTTIPTVSTTTENDSTSKPTTVSDIVIEVSSTTSTPTTTEASTSTELTTTSVTETPTETTPKPTGPPDHDCDKDDLDCIITETGEISDWFTCPEDMGSHPHPSSDKLFIFCLNWKPSVKKCGQDLVFSKELLTCTSP